MNRQNCGCCKVGSERKLKLSEAERSAAGGCILPRKGVRTTMGKRFKNWIGRAAAVLLTALLTAAPGAGATTEAEHRVLKVPFAEVPGLTETAEDGSRRGLVVDYLNEIAKYTDWEYEYIDTDGERMIQEFREGKYDLMGGTYYSSGFENLYAYPDYNIGYSKSVLMAREDDDRIGGHDLRSLNGKTIGVYERAAENVRRLREYLSMQGLDCEIRTYTYEQLSPEGKLYPYLENGEVDLLLGNGFEDPPGFRTVASFESQPYYIVTNVGNQEILDGLNLALGKIADSNPNFRAEQYAANFQSEGAVDIQLTAAERDYVRSRWADAVTVAVPNSYHPLFCPGSKESLHKGIVPEILDKIAAFTGLSFTYVYADTYNGALRMVRQGEAELLCFYLGTEQDSVGDGLALTSSYVDMNNIVVRSKTSSYPSDGLVGAVVEGQTLPAGIAAAEQRTYPTITDALRAVNSGKADFIYGLASRLELDIQRYHFSNLVPVTLVNDRIGLSFALQRPADTELLTILNKAINSLPDKERSMILDRNLVSIGTERLSLVELIYANPVTFADM